MQRLFFVAGGTSFASACNQILEFSQATKILSHKLLPELQIEHAIEKREHTQDDEVHSVFVNDSLPDKFTHVARFFEGI
jgi:hypothetical protein